MIIDSFIQVFCLAGFSLCSFVMIVVVRRKKVVVESQPDRRAVSSVVILNADDTLDKQWLVLYVQRITLDRKLEELDAYLGTLKDQPISRTVTHLILQDTTTFFINSGDQVDNLLHKYLPDPITISDN